ncbi:MAG: VacJ family lipoprotein [Burkholderiales bacterium]|nr:VacJ family lipoprotein [Burkholderiales bacterium]
MRPLKLLFLAALLAALAGCASMPHPNPRDPWEPMNRHVMQFNEGVDAVLLKPVATFYREKVPPLVRTGVSNFFSNLSDVWSAANSLAQLKIQNAAENFMRFNVNMLFGVGGLIDVASELNIERHKEDFGQTLGRYGVPAGPYVVLPLLGPSTLRDALALGVDRRLDGVQYMNPRWRNTFDVMKAIDTRANLLRVTAVLEDAALDKYSFVRDAHLQKRRAEVDSGTKREGSDANQGKEPDDTPGPAAAPAEPVKEKP